MKTHVLKFLNDRLSLFNFLFIIFKLFEEALKTGIWIIQKFLFVNLVVFVYLDLSFSCQFRLFSRFLSCVGMC